MPVPPERREAASGPLGRATAVSEFPGYYEVLYRRPLIGPTGQRLMDAFTDAGITREEVTLDNIVLCRPPGDSLDLFLIQVNQENDRLLAAGEPALLNPIEACSPHLDKTLAVTDTLLVLGSRASAAVGLSERVMKIVGSFMELAIGQSGSVRVTEENREALVLAGYRIIKAVPSFSPALVASEGGAKYARILKRVVERWAKWTKGKLDWVGSPLLTDHPSLQEVEAFLARPGPFAIDLEGTPEGPLMSSIRCIGIFDMSANEGKGEGIVIPWESISGVCGLWPGKPRSGWRAIHDEGPGDGYSESYYSEVEGKGIWNAVRRWFRSGIALFVGHNCTLFDWSLLEIEFGLLFDQEYLRGPQPRTIDTIFMARCEDSEIGRSLYLRGILETDINNWKGGGEEDDEIRWSPRSQRQLTVYNNSDNDVTARVARALWPRVVARGQMPLHDWDVELARPFREMTHLGLKVDQDVRAELERDYSQRVKEAREIVVDYARQFGVAELNPGSVPQLRKFLYGNLRLPVLRMTDSGLPSTNDDTLCDLIAMGEHRDLLVKVRYERGQSKLLSSVILPLRRWDDFRLDYQGNQVGGLCLPDGRVHPEYPTWGPATGRSASKKPNGQNIKLLLRVMCIPEKGNVYLIADYDQIELRLFAALAGIESYLRVFEASGDPHAMTALLIYGKRFEDELIKAMKPNERVQYAATKIPFKGDGGTVYTQLRTFAKTFVYCIIYGGTDETAYLAVSSATNDDGSLMFPDMTRAQVSAAYRAFMRNAPEIKAYWAGVEQFCREHGYVIEPIMGRRRDFPDFDRNGALNHGIQGAAYIVASKGLRNLRRRFVPDFRRRCGIVSFMHDSFTIETPEDNCEQDAKDMDQEIHMEFPDIPGVNRVVYPAATDICINWRGKKEDRWKKSNAGLFAPQGM